MIQPFAARLLAAETEDLVADLRERARDQHLVLGAEIGAPPDAEPVGRDRGQRFAESRKTTLSAASGIASRSFRPVVKCTGSPMRLSGIYAPRRAPGRR